MNSARDKEAQANANRWETRLLWITDLIVACPPCFAGADVQRAYTQ